MHCVCVCTGSVALQTRKPQTFAQILVFANMVITTHITKMGSSKSFCGRYSHSILVSSSYRCSTTVLHVAADYEPAGINRTACWLVKKSNIWYFAL